MFVKYNGKNIYSIPVPEGGNIVLKPGNNHNVDSKLWESATKNNLVIQGKLKSKLIIPVASKVETTKGEEKKKIEAEIVEAIKDGASKDLAEFNSNEAIDVVKETYDIEVLEEWQSDEKRKTVLKAVKNQLKEIASQGEAE